MHYHSAAMFRYQLCNIISIVNPFVNETVKPSAWEWVKCILMTILLVPIIRAVIFIVILILMAIWIFIVLIGHDKSGRVPMARWRRALLFPARILLRIGAFVIGFTYFKVIKPARDPNIEKANIIVANHIGHFDTLYFIIYHFPSGNNAAE